MSIGFRPYRSPRMPQIGLAIAIDRPETLAVAAVQRSSCDPFGTPRFWWMKIDRNGKAKLNPKIAMNSANHNAARLRRQSIPPGPVGGLVARGSVLRCECPGTDPAAPSHRLGTPMRALGGPARRRCPRATTARGPRTCALLLVPPLPSPWRPDRRLAGACRDTSPWAGHGALALSSSTILSE